MSVANGENEENIRKQQKMQENDKIKENKEERKNKAKRNTFGPAAFVADWLVGVWSTQKINRIFTDKNLKVKH